MLAAASLIILLALAAFLYVMFTKAHCMWVSRLISIVTAAASKSGLKTPSAKTSKGKKQRPILRYSSSSSNEDDDEGRQHASDDTDTSSHGGVADKKKAVPSQSFFENISSTKGASEGLIMYYYD